MDTKAHEPGLKSLLEPDRRGVETVAVAIKSVPPHLLEVLVTLPSHIGSQAPAAEHAGGAHVEEISLIRFQIELVVLPTAPVQINPHVGRDLPFADRTKALLARPYPGQQLILRAGRLLVGRYGDYLFGLKELEAVFPVVALKFRWSDLVDALLNPVIRLDQDPD